MTETLERTQKNKIIIPPRLWNVVFYNDDVTVKCWVVKLLIDLFGYTPQSADEKADSISVFGKGIVAVYPKSIAQQKASEAVTSSRRMGYPLNVTAERGDEE